MAKQNTGHSLFARVTHWVNASAVGLLITTGLYIRDPDYFTFFASMDLARKTHFIAMYVLIFGVVIRLYYSLISGDYRDFMFRMKDFKLLPGVVKYYLFMSNTLPKAGKYNPGQRLLYNVWCLMLIGQVTTGFMLYLPAHFQSYVRLAGGPVFIRQAHFLLAWMFVASAAGHVYLSITSGWSTVKSIIVGAKKGASSEGNRPIRA